MVELTKSVDDFVVPVTVSNQMIADLFITAMEGGSDYWCSAAHPKNWTPTEDDRLWYASTAYLSGPDFEVEAYDAESDEKFHVEGRVGIERGLAVMAKKYPRHFSDILIDNHDAETADVFFQCVILGDVVYG